MNRQWAVQIFSALAVIAGVLVSYFPPPHNAEAIWTLIGSFLGYGIRDLFGAQLASVAPLASTAAPVPVPASLNGQGGFARVGVMLSLVVAALLAFALSGCATAPTGGAQEAPQQVAARVCPAVQSTLNSLAAIDGLDEHARANLAQAVPVVSAACSATAVDMSSLQSLSETALPAMISVADAAPLDDEDKTRLVLVLTAGQIVLAGVLQAVHP